MSVIKQALMSKYIADGNDMINAHEQNKEEELYVKKSDVDSILNKLLQ